MQPEINPPSRGPWIIAGAIVLVGIIIALALVLVLRDNGGTAAPSASPAVTPASSATPTTPETTSPSPSTQGSPTPPPSPQPSQETAVRNAVEKQANKDRPGEVKHVGNIKFLKDKSCPNKQGASASVRFTTSPKAGTYFYCQQGSKWVYDQGPLYGE